MTNTTTTRYTITAAHRITGRSRTTIQKHIKKGKLSYEQGTDGVKLIDASELLRVYGDDCDFGRADGNASANGGTTPLPPSVCNDALALESQISTLLEERRREREQLQAQIEHLRDALRRAQEGSNRALLLLEDRSAIREQRSTPHELHTRIRQQETGPSDEAVREARLRLLDQPWWRVVWG